MVSLVPLLSTILPIVASTLLFLVIAVNIYQKIRRKFSISVNCWFCNSWTRVAYDDRNSFDCPTCSQYNGFTSDGDYNKHIPEQHDELMNRSQRVKTTKSAPSNGLCVLCNNNQQLKIFQLANFVPLVEENYDVEIEHFQQQLEKAYKLCKKCDKVLKKTLSRQSAWIFGTKLKNMCSNGFSKVTNQIKKETRTKFFSKLDGFITVILVCAVVFTTISNIKICTKTIATHVPTAYLPIYKNLIAGLNRSNIVEFNLYYFTKSVKIEPYSLICGVGLFFQLINMVRGHVRGSTKVNNLLCWVILFLISWVRYSKDFSSYVLFIEAFSCIYLLATAFAEPPKPQPLTSGRSMRKLVRNLETTCTDVSESSDFENISTSSQTYASLGDSSASIHKSIYSPSVPKSVYSDCVNRSMYSNLDTSHHSTAGNVLNASFASARTSPNDVDLTKSLNNLNLGGLFRPPKTAVLRRPRPVLSPPKLQTVNSWVAGGFWKDHDGVLVPLTQGTNLSRSSSESSGFGSQVNDFVPTRSNFYEFDRVSPTNFGFSPPEFRRNPNFYQNQVQRVGSPLFKFNEPYQRVENWSDRINSQTMQGFQDFKLHSS